MLRACLMVALGGRGGDRSRRHKSGRSISSEKAWRVHASSLKTTAIISNRLPPIPP